MVQVLPCDSACQTCCLASSTRSVLLLGQPFCTWERHATDIRASRKQAEECLSQFCVCSSPLHPICPLRPESSPPLDGPHIAAHTHAMISGAGVPTESYEAVLRGPEQGPVDNQAKGWEPWALRAQHRLQRGSVHIRMRSASLPNRPRFPQCERLRHKQLSALARQSLPVKAEPLTFEEPPADTGHGCYGACTETLPDCAGLQLPTSPRAADCLRQEDGRKCPLLWLVACLPMRALPPPSPRKTMSLQSPFQGLAAKGWGPAQLGPAEQTITSGVKIVPLWQRSWWAALVLKAMGQPVKEEGRPQIQVDYLGRSQTPLC